MATYAKNAPELSKHFTKVEVLAVKKTPKADPTPPVMTKANMQVALDAFGDIEGNNGFAMIASKAGLTAGQVKGLYKEYLKVHNNQV